MEAPDGAPLHPAHAERLHKFAHDLRNRLMGLHQAMQTLGGSDDNGERAELMLFGEQQFFKALREVEAMLDDLGVDRRPRITTQHRMDLDQVVQQGIGHLEHRFQRKAQHVAVTLVEGLDVTIDPHHADQLVGALLSNASKFADRGTTVHVELASADGRAVLHVRDEGVGLTASDLEQLFVRYAWLESRSTEGEAQGRGTLARMRELARSYGGDLTASSPGAGSGTTFALALPLAR